MKILDNAKDKIEKCNNFDLARVKSGKMGYNAAYQKILEERHGNLSLVDAVGTVSDDKVELLWQTMIAFDMKDLGQIDDDFVSALKRKLSTAGNITRMNSFKNHTILQNIEVLKQQTEAFFEDISEKNCLSAKKLRFGVGATKIMNFLFPELFLMVDSNVKKALHLQTDTSLSFDDYWMVMSQCQQELQDWQDSTIESLKSLDEGPTTPIRAFDKCAFAMGKGLYGR